MRPRTLLPALALVLLALALCLGQPARAQNGGPGQAPDSTSGPTRITIPSLKVDSAVEPVGYQLTDRSLGWQTVENAVGWHRSSAMPGSPGNTVMSGHNATRGSRVFRDLYKIKEGAAITVASGGVDHQYAVTDIIILPYVFASEHRRAQIVALLGQHGDERLTLVTCYPWFTNTHRLLVVAHPVESARSP